MKTWITFAMLFSLGFMSLADSQVLPKHPRVVQLESELTRQAIDLLRGRFPDKPFLVTVSIDPLHRYTERPSTVDADRLPLSWQDDEEIRDEWDDPSLPTNGLIARVRKAVVTISVPSSISDDEVAEVQQSVVSALSLTPARDEVKIFKRTWGQPVDKFDETPLIWASIGLLLSFLALYMISRGSVGRLARAIQESASKATGQASAPAQAPLLGPDLGIKSKGAGQNGDLKFTDPLRTREVILQTVEILLTQHRKVFPTLQDMILLDHFGLENPSSLGALILEFPMEQQRTLFSYSFGTHWLNSLNEPGELTPSCLDILQRLVRNARHEGSREWEDLLIAMWRLESRRVEFIRSLDQSDAFSVLSHLPKSLAVSIARSAFPGSWGVVLDPKFTPKDISADRLVKLTQNARAMVPLRDYKVLERFRQQKDLLDYLKVVEPNEEREIYAVTPSDSLIHSLRPAFFHVLEMKPEQAKVVVPAISLDQWALAMFNIPKSDRRGVESQFSEKQRFLYFERLKQLDARNPSQKLVGEAREFVAATAISILKNAQQDSITKESTSDAPVDATKSAA